MQTNPWQMHGPPYTISNNKRNQSPPARVKESLWDPKLDLWTIILIPYRGKITGLPDYLSWTARGKVPPVISPGDIASSPHMHIGISVGLSHRLEYEDRDFFMLCVGVVPDKQVVFKISGTATFRAPRLRGDFFP